jgi:hypothetical protein
MNANDRRTPANNERPESQPHGTTEDQIHEMESEGQGHTTNEEPKPKATPPPNRTTPVSIPRGTVVK